MVEMGTELCCATQRVKGRNFSVGQLGSPFKNHRMDSSMENRRCRRQVFWLTLDAFRNVSQHLRPWQRSGTMRLCRLSRLRRTKKCVAKLFCTVSSTSLSVWIFLGTKNMVQKKGHPSRTTGWSHSATLIVKRSVTLQIYPFLCFQWITMNLVRFYATFLHVWKMAWTLTMDSSVCLLTACHCRQSFSLTTRRAAAGICTGMTTMSWSG